MRYPVTSCARPRRRRPGALARALVRALLAATILACCSCGGTADDGRATSPGRTSTPGAVAGVVAPPVNGRFDYQIGGAYPPVAGVTIVERDRGERPAARVYSVCYVNAFQSQPQDESFWMTTHPDLLVRDGGGPIEDPDWPGEYLLDTSTAAHRNALAAIVGSWIDGCAAKGFRAVEPDNLDSWTRSKGRLTRSDNLAFAALLIARAHQRKLAVAQKNTAEISVEGRRAGFDFAVAEECQAYGECDDYTDVYGDHVIEIEYTDNPRNFYPAACVARGARVSIILRDRDVVPAGDSAYHYEDC